jgi:hypothetical protein
MFERSSGKHPYFSNKSRSGLEEVCKKTGKSRHLTVNGGKIRQNGLWLLTLVEQGAVYVIGEATRLATTYVFDLPSDYSTKQVHVYVGWISENGKEIANSKYAGNILIA